MSLDTLYGAAVSTAFAADISLVSILQEGHWPRLSTQARLFFSIGHYYRSAPGFYTAHCPGCQGVVNLLISVKH